MDAAIVSVPASQAVGRLTRVAIQALADEPHARPPMKVASMRLKA
jgi:hypothetical protein